VVGRAPPALNFAAGTGWETRLVTAWEIVVSKMADFAVRRWLEKTFNQLLSM